MFRHCDIEWKTLHLWPFQHISYDLAGIPEGSGRDGPAVVVLQGRMLWVHCEYVCSEEGVHLLVVGCVAPVVNGFRQ